MVEYNGKFHWADYLLFALSLVITVIVGLVIAYRDKWHKQNKESYLMANRRMHWFLVGLSFLNTAQSAMTFIAIPSEYYYYGIGFVFSVIGYYIGAIFTAIFIIPKFYRLGFLVTSAYEYFQHRFNLVTRMLVGFCYVIVNLLDIGVTLYIPSLVLSQVSVLNIYWSSTIGAVVCLIYTAFGGMKAVILVDSVQVLIVAAGFCTMAAKGVIDAGGINKVWEIYAELGERNNWRDLNPEPWNRHSLWNVIFLIGMLLCASFGTNQAQLQRYMTVPKMRNAQLSIIWGITVSMVFVAVVVLMSMAAFAHLGGNDPLLNRDIDRSDQIIPYFLMYLLGDLHGIPGLVVAALYAAALSSLSSGQSATVAVLVEDIIQPIHTLRTKRKLNEKAAGLLARILGVVVGLVVLGLAIIIPYLGSSLFELSLTIGSFFYGPVLGIMLCGFFAFWIEEWGAVAGFTTSVGWAVMMYYCSRLYGSGLGRDKRPLFRANFTERIEYPNPTAEPTLFDVSYLWYVLLDVLVLIVVATVVSLIVHCKKHGRLRASDMMPDKAFRYTTEDFLVAIGCKKNDINGTGEDADKKIYKMDKAEADGFYINSAYEKTYL